ncbi:hypothetical protein [Streptomyces sp. NPDC048266]|uniref:hypothetical protein n=1 Tax=Streptomyces sp. NPDC048266 TaxID=3155787 RepID=UPI0033C4346A
MAYTDVSVQLTPDGYTVTCPGTLVTGYGPTEAAAWNDFWTAYKAQWEHPTPLTIPSNVNDRQPRRRPVRTLRIRDLFG